MTDFRLLNGRPKVTVIQRFNRSILLITPTLEKLEFPSGEKPAHACLEYVDDHGWEINIEHLHPAGGEG